MIFVLNLRQRWLAASLGLGLAFAGCKTSNPPPPTPAVPSPPVLPVATNPPPMMPVGHEPVSRPRPAADQSDNMATNILLWDGVTKEYQARAGETNALFAFSVTNVFPERVLIYDVSTTCECTVAQLPARPWALPPGSGGVIHATLDLQNRTTEAVTNYVIVFTSKGNRLLTVKGILPKR